MRRCFLDREFSYAQVKHRSENLEIREFNPGGFFNYDTIYLSIDLSIDLSLYAYIFLYESTYIYIYICMCVYIYIYVLSPTPRVQDLKDQIEMILV